MAVVGIHPVAKLYCPESETGCELFGGDVSAFGVVGAKAGAVDGVADNKGGGAFGLLWVACCFGLFEVDEGLLGVHVFTGSGEAVECAKADF